MMGQLAIGNIGNWQHSHIGNNVSTRNLLCVPRTGVEEVFDGLPSVTHSTKEEVSSRQDAFPCRCKPLPPPV